MFSTFRTFVKLIFLLLLLAAALAIIYFSFTLISNRKVSTFLSPLGKTIKGKDPLNIASKQKMGGKSDKKNMVFGFLPYWMLKNHKYLRYDLLTTIAYFGLHIDKNGEFVKIKDDGTSQLGWLNWKTNRDLEEVIKNAKANNVRVALSVVAQDNETIEEFLDCPQCWDTLIKELISELNKKQMTDVALDFEYHGVPDQRTRNQYPIFVSEVTDRLHRTIPGSQVTVATFAEAAYKVKLHDIERLGRAADAIFIMAYDFHLLTDDKTGPIAPLSGAPDKYKYDLENMLKDYLRFTEAEKLIMGVAYYGYDWITENEKLGSLRIPGNETIGFSHASYYGICEYHKENTGIQKRWDEDAKTPWFYYYDEVHDVYRQCHYENRESLSAKYDFIKEHNLRGVGIWALGYDGKYNELWELMEEKFN